MSALLVETAGERVALECALPWVRELLLEAAGGALGSGAAATASVRVQVEAARAPFPTRGFALLTRCAWRRDREVVLENACSSGFDLRVVCAGDESATVVCRFRPPRRERVAALLLRSRFHLLARAVLLQYPALWWAGTRGRAPLHASALRTATATPLLVSPGGVGRSTLVREELERGAAATGDNLTVGDGETVWGVVEPLRLEGGEGRRMPHGRREAPLARRVDALVPDALVVVERVDAAARALRPCTAAAAVRALVASTYMAGELRRYWAFAATLAAGTGLGSAHPPVEAVASELADRLPCLSLVLGSRPAPRLSELLEPLEAAP